MADNTDKRIQLRESVRQMVVSAAARRCVSPAAFISMVMYDYLRASGEVDMTTPVSVQSVPVTSTPVSSNDPFASLPDPRKLAESLNFEVNFLEDDEAPMTPETQAVLDVWDED